MSLKYYKNNSKQIRDTKKRKYPKKNPKQMRTDDKRWCWKLYSGSKSTIVSLSCLPMALYTIYYLTDVKAIDPLFHRTHVTHLPMYVSCALNT